MTEDLFADLTIPKLSTSDNSVLSLCHRSDHIVRSHSPSVREREGGFNPPVFWRGDLTLWGQISAPERFWTSIAGDEDGLVLGVVLEGGHPLFPADP